MKKIYLLILLTFAFCQFSHGEIDIWQFRTKADFKSWEYDSVSMSYDTLYFKHLNENEVALLSVGTIRDSIEIPSYVTNAYGDNSTIYHVTAIADSAFYASEYLHASLRTIILPENIKTIGDRAFMNFSNLEDFYLYTTTPPALGQNAFTNIGNATLHVPCQAYSQYTDVSMSSFPHYFTSIESMGHVYEIRDWVCTSNESYIWNGNEYSISGIYTETFVTADGCDSIVTLQLTFNSPSERKDTVVTCYNSPIKWNGKWYDASGDYTDTLVNVFGCDSIVTLHLTVLPPSPDGVDTAIVCDSYVWHGIEYNKTGDYLHMLRNVAGCDSLATLHLIVDQSVCASYVEDITKTTATLKWIADSAVTQYDINVYTGGVHFAQYLVDGKGQLISSQHFAPSIYHHKLDTTNSSTDYFVISLDGLSAGTDYNYTIDGTNADNAPIYHEEGQFTTKWPEGVILPVADDPHKQARKIIKDGQLLILRNGRIYTLNGIEIQQTKQ